MDGRMFIDSSRKGAMALRNFVDQKSRKPDFDWYQQTYADNVLRKFLARNGLFDVRRTHQSPRASMGWSPVRVLGRQSSLDHVSERRTGFDHDTLHQVTRLLGGSLPDAELQSLGKKIGDIITQLDVSSPQRNALAALFNYINAQGSIALGYSEDILTPKNQSGDVIAAIGWPLWSIPSLGASTWGADFVRRIQYVSSQGGDITFILPEGEYGYTFTAQGICTSYCIWKEILRRIDSMDPKPDYRRMPVWSDVVGNTFFLQSNEEDFRILYAYYLFRYVYGVSNSSDNPIFDAPIDKSAIGAHIEDAIQALADKNLSRSNQLGATSHFEFVYLLCAGTEFKIIAGEEKVRSFVDFSTDEQDPDQQEFRDKIRALMASLA
ncbi:MAG: hypothetical protein LBJ75_02105 [Puniceicoccales bacterium]|nr:hypothetical protein [Puniceicoccales bacterium]